MEDVISSLTQFLIFEKGLKNILDHVDGRSRTGIGQSPFCLMMHLHLQHFEIREGYHSQVVSVSPNSMQVAITMNAVLIVYSLVAWSKN